MAVGRINEVTALRKLSYENIKIYGRFAGAKKSQSGCNNEAV